MPPLTHIPAPETTRTTAGGRGSAHIPPPIWLKIDGKRREGRRSPQGTFESRHGAQTGLVVRFMFHSRLNHNDVADVKQLPGIETPLSVLSQQGKSDRNEN